MAKLNVPPTKSSLLSVQRDLEVALEGYDLLEQKRQILVIELMSQVARARTIQQEVDQALERAYRVVREAALTLGAETMRRQAAWVRGGHRLRLTSRQVMGIGLPAVSLEVSPQPPGFATTEGAAQADRLAQAFRQVLTLVGQLAEVETVVFRLSRELRKTQRRVNALDKIFIPAYRQTISYITSVLEEREREEFITMKKLKARAEKREEERR